MGNQWGRGGTGFPHASFNSFGGPRAPFGGAPRAPALPAASPRGSPGRDAVSRGERARRDPGGGRSCKGESTWGRGAAHGAPAVGARPCERAWPSERGHPRARARSCGPRERACAPCTPAAAPTRAAENHGWVQLPHAEKHRRLPGRGDRDGDTRCHLRPLRCPGGLSTDTLITPTGLQIASAGLRKCRGVQRGEEKVERGERRGCWRVRKGPCPSPGIAAVLGLPRLHPEALAERIFGLRPPPSGRSPAAPRVTEPPGPTARGN